MPLIKALGHVVWLKYVMYCSMQVEAQDATIAGLNATIAGQDACLKTLEARLEAAGL